MSDRNKFLESRGVTKVVNYLRRSRQDLVKEKETGQDTLHEQKILMDRVLSEYGMPYSQKSEIGSGDKIETRPVFQKIITDLKNEKYDSIAVKEISRMGRGSYSDMGVIYDLIVEKRIYIITPWKIYDPTNPSDLRQIRFELFMSREEFETTRERLSGGRYNAAMEGKWVAGPAPFGYDYDKRTKKLIINEDEAKIVRTIFDFYANGIITDDGTRKLVQFKALATYLKRVGIKTVRGKDEWSPIFLKGFLKNERYFGTLRYNTTFVSSEGKKLPRPKNEHIVVYEAHPAIIDKETWEKTQYRINNRDTHTNTKLDFEPNRLAGLFVCKKCGKKFIRRAAVQRYKKKDGTVSTYEKTMLFCGTTGCTYVRYNVIEEDVLETLKTLTDLDDDTLEKSISNITIDDEPKDPLVDIKKHIEGKRSELNRRMEFIYEKFESGIYSDAMFLERKTEIDNEMHELDKIRINEDEYEHEDEIDVDHVKSKINSVLEAYNYTDDNRAKNELLHSVFSHINIEVLEKGSGTRGAVHRIEPFMKARFISQ